MYTDSLTSFPACKNKIDVIFIQYYKFLPEKEKLNNSKGIGCKSIADLDIKSEPKVINKVTFFIFNLIKFPFLFLTKYCRIFFSKSKETF